MSDRYIDVKITKEGKLVAEAIGYVGPACETATRYIDDAVAGAKVVEQRTDDYYRSETEKVSQ